MKGSIFAFFGALALSFLSLGYISLLLYAAAYPVLILFYPPLSEWRGPWVWPVLVGVAILWAFAFLIAGIVNWRLTTRGWSKTSRRGVYLAVLWIGAVAAWLIVLGANRSAIDLGPRQITLSFEPSPSQSPSKETT